MIRVFPRSMASIKRISEVIGKVPEEGNGTEGPEGFDLEFDHVTFTYPGQAAPVLSDISFRASPGQTLAVIGPTGCGKSALVNLIMGFYHPDSGTVRMGGKDIREYDIREYRRHLGYAPQNPVLFDTTVRENVNYGAGSEGRGDAEVLEALRVAQAEDFVNGMGGIG